ncbi:hypothetical protein BH18ACT4_BH18ACT4_03040 [soil metagenome]
MFILALLIAGCGGADDSASPTTDADADADETTTAPSDDDAATDGAATDGAATDEPAPEFSGEGSDELCDFAEQINEADIFSGEDATQSPEELEDRLTELNAALVRANDLAPDEIAADLAVASQSFPLVIDLYEQFDSDSAAPAQALQDDPALFAPLSDPEVMAASQNVDAYFRDVCGIEDDAG